MFLLPSLSLHLLDLNGVRLSAAHVELMVAHAQGQDPLVDTETRCVEHKVLNKKRRTCMFQYSGKGLCVWGTLLTVVLCITHSVKCTQVYEC